MFVPSFLCLSQHASALYLHLPVSLSLFLPSNLPSYLHTYLCTYLPTYFPTYVPIYLPTYVPIYLPTYKPTFLPTYLSTFLPTCLLLPESSQQKIQYLTGRRLSICGSVSSLSKNFVVSFPHRTFFLSFRFSQLFAVVIKGRHE